MIKKNKKNGQSMLEFTFCMIIIMLMMYSMMMIFRWVGLDLAERSQAHDKVIFDPFRPRNYDYDEIFTHSPATQLNEYFYKPIKMNAISNAY